MTAHKFVNTLLCEMIWRRQAMPGFEVSLTIVYIRLAKCGVTFLCNNLVSMTPSHARKIMKRRKKKMRTPKILTISHRSEETD